MSIFDDTSPSWAATPRPVGNGAEDGALGGLDPAAAKAKAGYPQIATPAAGQASSTNNGNQAGNGGFMGSMG